MVTGIELAEMESATVFVEPLDVFVKPYVLSSDGRDTFRFQADLLDRIL